MRRRSELCAFKFEDICQAPNGKPAIKLNFSKTDQFRTGKILPISQELLGLLEIWRSLISGYSFKVGAALDLLEQGEPLERIMLRGGGWQTDSTAMSYLRNWIV